MLLLLIFIPKFHIGFFVVTMGNSLMVVTMGNSFMVVTIGNSFIAYLILIPKVHTIFLNYYNMVKVS